MIAKRIVYDQIKARNSPLISFDVSLKLHNQQMQTCQHGIKERSEEIDDKSDKAATKTNYIEIKIYVEVAQKKR